MIIRHPSDPSWGKPQHELDAKSKEQLLKEELASLGVVIYDLDYGDGCYHSDSDDDCSQCRGVVQEYYADEEDYY